MDRQSVKPVENVEMDRSDASRIATLTAHPGWKALNERMDLMYRGAETALKTSSKPEEFFRAQGAIATMDAMQRLVVQAEDAVKRLAIASA